MRSHAHQSGIQLKKKIINIFLLPFFILLSINWYKNNLNLKSDVRITNDIFIYYSDKT